MHATALLAFTGIGLHGVVSFTAFGWYAIMYGEAAAAAAMQ